MGLLLERVSSPQLLCFPVPQTVPGAAVWSIPLWSERGLSGLLLLGPKTDGALYTQEEIELARATGERLLDTQASATMARRLMVLQRERLAETQVVDRRTRRLLHDEVLPRLHAVLLMLSARGQSSDSPAASAVQEAVDALVEVHQEIAALLRSTPPALAPEVARLGVVAALRQVIDGEFAGDFDSVAWEMDPEVERAARRLPATSAEVLFYAVREAIRNAARHGRAGDAERPLSLTLRGSVDDDLSITVEDSGVGFDTHAGSRGHGLVLHTTMMAVIGGTLAIDSTTGVGTRTRLTIPVADAVPPDGPSARVTNLSWS
jgi:signal transduction histidine kinase